ncbi:MAG: MarR family winged helix-turn-helix transcriptional regulator [Oscillibacter sp.]|jgi:DNA-binding MarR family transcriptional regulator|nr:MarR family winged helix-turn-helix transcriptional regulator [Oscillibacter sp.]
MEPTESIARELKILSNKLNRKAEASLSPHLKCEVTEMQGRVVGFLFLNQNRDIFQKDVEAEFSITRATASKMLTAMEHGGLITRCGVAGDARLKKLVLTEKSMHHMAKIRQGMIRFEEELTCGLTQEERATLLTLLRKLERNLEDTSSCCPCTRKGETV